MGLGSGTQLALAVFTAIAEAHGQPAGVRDHAPALGRGGRSGVGVATFEEGGLVVDAGHPTEQFTSDPPTPGSWQIPTVTTRVVLPDSWRILLVIPAARRGRSGATEDASMRTVIETADAAIADEIDRLLTADLLPAIDDAAIVKAGAAMTAIGRANGRWYRSVQGGQYRSPADGVIGALESAEVIHGIGQSSWGPAVYGLIRARDSETAKQLGQHALAKCGVDGSVRVVNPASTGAAIDHG
ncbi:MAG: GHMP kinase [Natrialbaceae archaeon]|nr:GHMP kinase [Natrialbaceae archaeon]